MERLLSWLKETEAQMDGGIAGMEKMEKSEKEDNCDQLTQQLNLCKASLSEENLIICSATSRRDV